MLLGYNRKSLELKHWKEMIENPRRPIVHWHLLKVNTTKNQTNRTCSTELRVGYSRVEYSKGSIWRVQIRGGVLAINFGAKALGWWG